MKIHGVILGVLVVSLAASAHGVEGRRITYQGQITGVPVENVVAVRARIFSSATAVAGDTLLWGEERHQVEPDADGSFVIVLGATDLDLRRVDPNSPGLTDGSDGIPDLDQVTSTKFRRPIRLPSVVRHQISHLRIVETWTTGYSPSTTHLA